MNGISPNANVSPWPRRAAVVLVCVTFPLLWVGGLVTTTDAGMAFPDWPTSRGYNLFLYPWQTWLFGPWDMFVEHGHRLLGAVAGIAAIVLVAAVCLGDKRRWMRGAAAAALLLVIVQGVLGGLRVLADDRGLALAHACVGPAFFALAVSLAAFTSSWWREGPAHEGGGQEDDPTAAAVADGKLCRLALLTASLAYAQLVLGAFLRHMPADASPGLFRVAVFAHLLMAAVVVFHAVYLAVRAARARHVRARSLLAWPTRILAGLVLLQLALGAAAWVAKYSWPGFLARYDFTAGHTVEANSWMQTTTITAHVAGGSLIVAIAVLAAIRAMRLVPRAAMLPGRESSPMGALA